MTFKEYIHRRPPLENSSGDFIRDARAAHDFPDNPASWPELKTYLEVQRGACPQAVKAGHQVWRTYRDYVKRRVLKGEKGNGDIPPLSAEQLALFKEPSAERREKLANIDSIIIEKSNGNVEKIS